MAETQEFIATGRRKTSVARIRMTPGSGKIEINGKSFEDYFPTIPLQNTLLQPLQPAKLISRIGRETAVAVLRHERLANPACFVDLLLFLEQMYFGIQSDRGDESFRIASYQPLIRG